MNQQETIDLDKTEIKGNIKTFVAIIASTITIVASVFVCANRINSSIVELRITYQKQNEMNDYRYQTFDGRLGRDEQDVKDIRKVQDDFIANLKH